MIKTLNNIFRQDREKFVVPKSVQQVIPIQTVWNDGIFKVGRNKFSRSYRFPDINYAVAGKEDKEIMFLDYSDLLNAFDSGATTKITIHNRRLNRQDFEKSILIPMTEDGLDLYRKEYNAMLLGKATGANSMVQEKYVTVSAYRKTIEEARTYFSRTGTELTGHFARLGSNAWRWMPRTGCGHCMIFTGRGKKRDSALIWRKPCGRDTALRTLSARTALNLKKTISVWETAMGVFYFCGSMPLISRMI